MKKMKHKHMAVLLLLCLLLTTAGCAGSRAPDGMTEEAAVAALCDRFPGFDNALPDQAVTRAAFLAAIGAMRTHSVDADTGECSDYPQDTALAGDIAQALPLLPAEMRVDGTKLCPDEPITNEEADAVFYHYLKADTAFFAADLPALRDEASCPSLDTFHSWAQEAVASLYAGGLLKRDEVARAQEPLRTGTMALLLARFSAMAGWPQLPASPAEKTMLKAADAHHRHGEDPLYAGAGRRPAHYNYIEYDGNGSILAQGGYSAGDPAVFDEVAAICRPYLPKGQAENVLRVSGILGDPVDYALLDQDAAALAAYLADSSPCGADEAPAAPAYVIRLGDTEYAISLRPLACNFISYDAQGNQIGQGSLSADAAPMRDILTLCRSYLPQAS